MLILICSLIHYLKGTEEKPIAHGLLFLNTKSCTNLSYKFRVILLLDIPQCGKNWNLLQLVRDDKTKSASWWADGSYVILPSFCFKTHVNQSNINRHIADHNRAGEKKNKKNATCLRTLMFKFDTINYLWSRLSQLNNIEQPYRFLEQIMQGTWSWGIHQF